MALYRVQAPNGKTYQIEGPAGAPQALIVQALLAQYPDAAKPPPETTVLGQVKEGFKGLVPGAVGLVESAAVGASALLPEGYEKTAREKIASIAGAAKAPFAASAGYEESVGRKLGEAIGSTVPFLAAGPLGLAGRIGAVGLGVGAGAGEARGRAEKESATAEQRSTATALGIIPGAMEVFAPFRILSRIPDAATAQGVQLVKRAALAGGEEAAQEAASGFAQNLIAKGVYKPEQELIEGLGEQAAYGGATGAIVQGLMDLALGRRARAAQPAADAVPGETPIERAERLAAEQAAAKAAAQPSAPPAAGILPPPDTYAELVLYSEQLKMLPKSKERDEALKLAAEKRKALNVAYIEEQRSASEAAKGFMTAEEAAAAQITPREEVTAPPEGQAPAAPVEEPKVRKVGEPPATGLQPADIEALGVSKKQPIYRRMLGKDLEDPAQRDAVLADIENYLVRGNGTEESRTKLTEFKAKFAPPPAAEAAPTPPPTPPVQPETPSASTQAREGYWRPNPEEPGNKNSWQDTFGFIHYDVNYPLPKGGRVKDLVEATQSNEIQVVFENSKGEEKILSVYAAKGKKPYWRGAGDMTEAQIETGLGSELYNAIGDKALETEAELDALVAKIRGILSKPTETPSVAEPQPEAGGAGVPVAGGPAAVSTAEGVGPEPDGVVPPIADVAGTTGGKGAEPTAVTPPTPTAAPSPPPPPPPPPPTPAQIERELATLVDSGRITEEQAADYRAELLGEAEEAPTTAMGQAFQKQIDDIKAQMDALRQKSGKPPAPKSKNRAKFDELEAQLNALSPVETGTLKEKLEKAEATGVFEVRDGKPILDIPAVRQALKGRDPKMLKAVLTYIGVDEDGDYLPTTYSADEAAQSVGLAKSSGANVRRIAETLGITADVVSRFQAAQTGAIGIAKNVSEASLSGISVENPKAGLLYETGKKGVKAVGFLRPALTETGQLDFSKLDTRQLADIYSRASRYDAKNNTAVMQQLNAEVEARRKADRAGTDAAINRAYGKLVAEEEAQAEEEVETVEEGAGEPEFDDKTRRLSDEDVESETRAATPAYPEVEDAEAKRIEDQIRGKSLIEAAEFIAGYFKVGDQKLIAQRVVDRLRRMEAAGFDFNLVLVEPGVKAPTSVAVGNANGLSKFVYANNRPEVTVYLRAANMDASGINPRIMLHEFLHAATQAAIHLGNLRGSVGSNTAKFASELIDLQNAFIKHFNQRVTDSKAGKITLTEMEEAILKRNVNAGLDPHELLAWGMTNPKFQQYLETIPYKARTMWTAFVDSVRSFLGMAPRMDTALSELLHVSESILNSDPNEEVALSRRIWGTQAAPGVQTPAITAQTEAAVEDVDVIGEKERQTLTQRIAQDLKGNPALKLRMKFTDSLAPLEDFFVNAYGGATRTTKTGRLNPMVLLSRALDSLRVSKAVQEQGGLGFDSGLIVAKDLKNAEGKPVSYTGVLNRIAEAAKQRGETYEAFRTKLDTVLYGHREHGLRETNKTLPKTDRIELLLPDAKIDELEAAFQKDDFIKQVSADLDTIRFNLLDTLVDTGRISKEQAQDYKDATGYIPFNRLGDYEKVYQSTKGANRGVAALRNIRKLEGSTRQTASPVENFSGLVDWATKEAMKNHAALSALKDMALMGAAFKRPTKPAKDSPGDMVTVYDNGKPVEYYVPDPAHFIAFSIQDPVIPDSFKLLQKGSQILRAGVTSMPPFAIKQVFDDIVRAYTYAGVKNNAALVKSVMLNFPKNWVNEVLKKKPKDIKNLEALGIVGTFDFSQQGNLKNILEGAGAKKEGLGSTIMRVMEAGAKASDLAVRQAVYDQVMKETNGDKAQAESAAREIINFSRRGSSKTMNLLISIIPFFNAYARGMDKLATAAAGGVVGQSTGTARSMFYKRMGVMTSMGLLYALLMQDDEEYQQLPDHVRDTNWILPYGKELGFVPAIPIPAELAFFFKAIPERIVRYYKLYGTEEEQTALDVVGNMTKRGIDVFSSPNITAQMIRPFLENMVNHSFFLDRPLESQAQQALRPFERYGTGTSDAMKSLAKSMEDVANATGVEAFAISPIKLENVVRGIFGTAGGLALSIADMGLNPGRTDRPLNQQLGAQLTGLSAVTKDPIGTRQLDFIYDLEKRVEQVNGTVNRLTERKPEDVDQFIKDNIGLYSIRGPVQGVMSGIRALNQAAMMIDRDTSLSPEERRKRIDELRVEQNKLAQQAQMLRKMARDIQMGR
jgi:polyhydroxyalkanoate synthesis regulator phasin